LSKTGLRQRVGYFGANNGVYFEQTNGTKNMVIRSSSSGILVEERIAQADWNTDKLNGAVPWINFRYKCNTNFLV